MNKLNRLQAVSVLVMLVGLVWLTIDVFDTIEPDSLQAAAIVTWAGLIGGSVCLLIRLKKKSK